MYFLPETTHLQMLYHIIADVVPHICRYCTIKWLILVTRAPYIVFHDTITIENRHSSPVFLPEYDLHHIANKQTRQDQQTKSIQGNGKSNDWLMKPVVAHVLSRKINFMRRPGSELLSSTGFNPDNVSCKDNRQTFTNISTGMKDFFLRQTKQTRKQANKQKSTNQIEGCWIFPYAAQSAQLVVELKQGAALLPLTVFIPGLFFLPPNFSCDCYFLELFSSPAYFFSPPTFPVIAILL